MSEIVQLVASEEETLIVVTTEIVPIADEAPVLDDQPLVIPPPAAPTPPVVAGPVKVEPPRRRKGEELSGHWQDATRAQMSQVGITFYG